MSEEMDRMALVDLLYQIRDATKGKGKGENWAIIRELVQAALKLLIVDPHERGKPVDGFEVLCDIADAIELPSGGDTPPDILEAIRKLVAERDALKVQLSERSTSLADDPAAVARANELILAWLPHVGLYGMDANETRGITVALLRAAQSTPEGKS